MEEKKQIENEYLTKVYHTNHIVEAITVEKRCTGIARYRKKPESTLRAKLVQVRLIWKRDLRNRVMS